MVTLSSRFCNSQTQLTQSRTVRMTLTYAIVKAMSCHDKFATGVRGSKVVMGRVWAVTKHHVTHPLLCSEHMPK